MVFAVMSVILTFVMLLVMTAVAIVIGSFDGIRISGGFPAWAFIGMPIVYGILAYISVFMGCVVYNKLYWRLGGIELEYLEFGSR